MQEIFNPFEKNSIILYEKKPEVSYKYLTYDMIQ